MGGIGDFLFGEEPETRIESMPTMSPEQMALLNKLSTLLTGELGKGVTPYGGQITAELSGLEQEGIERAGGFGGAGMDFLSNILGRSPEAEEDYWRKAFVDPSMMMWEKKMVPQLMEKYSAMGAGDSGAARRALAEGASSLTTNLGSRLGEIMYKSQFDKMQIPGMGMDLIAKMMGAGAVGRGVEQAKGQEAYGKWQQAQPWANPWLQHLGIPMSVQPMQNMMYQTGGSQGLLGSMMPMIGQGIGSWLGGGGLSGLFGGASSAASSMPQMYSMSNPGWYSGWTIG